MHKKLSGFIASITSITVVAMLAGSGSVLASEPSSLFFNVNASDPASYNPSSPSTWTDLSAANRNGTILGSLTYDAANGALVFPGGTNSTNSLGYVDMGEGFNNFGQGITIEFEGHFGSVNQAWERIFDFGNGAESNNIWVGVLGESGYPNELAIELWDGSTAKGRCISRGQSLLNASNQAGTFAKYVITLDGTTCRMYKDGVEIKTAVGTTSFGSGAFGSAYAFLPPNIVRSKNYIGRSNWGTDAAFNGAIKYVRIYTEAISSQDVVDNSTTYTLTYATTGSDSGTAPSAKTGNGLISLDENSGNLVKANHTFIGWASAANQTTALASPYTLQANTTLYPVFAPNTYNVTYDSRGGSAVSSSSFTHGGSLTFPVNPTRAGHTFLGWFAAASGGEPLTASSVASGNASVTLFAQWITNQVVTWSPTNTSVLTNQSPLAPSSAATSSGDGAISYSVISPGSTSCTVNSSTGALTFSGVGNCTVRASAQATSNYLGAHTDVTFSIGSSSPAMSLSLEMTAGDSVDNADVEYGASGLKENSDWMLVLRSTPQTLASGSFSSAVLSGTAQLPAGLSAGWHSITLSGVSPTGSTISQAVWFEISETGTLVRTAGVAPETSNQSRANAAGLAATGTRVGLPLTVSLILALVGAAALVSRRISHRN